MKQGVNKVTLIGYVGDSPRINETKEKNQVANFSLATHDFYRDKSGKEIQRTEWHRLVAWDKRAGFVKDYVKKGDPLYVEGKLRTSSYEDKEGVKRYSTEIFCDNVLFVSAKDK
jgi:single-strand DNA-binding protein